MNSWPHAVRHFVRYLELSSSGLGIHAPTAIEALLNTLAETNGDTEAVPEFYRLSLACTVESELLFSLLTAEAVWDARTALDEEDERYPTAIAAGVWYAVHRSLAGRDDATEIVEVVQAAVEPQLDRLSPTARALYTLRFTDETATLPSTLRELLNVYYM